MVAQRSESGWRATALVVALFAITLNFLQPIAHAALMRSGAPSTLWSAICASNAGYGEERDANGQAPMAPSHDCCLGLAHAAVVAPPAALEAPFTPIVTAVAVLADIDPLAAVGIRDGPSSPRGPPTLS
ncbi:MAG: DUF2946 family protein [Proteobacteria bacterium]|nr:DUF2946 family protein [Pseudomonadota bacterium]